MKLNKVCELEDFADPDLADAIRDVGEHKRARLPGFPKGAEHRKDWEIAMAVLALRQFGALERQSLVLGVAAGAEDTLFYLTRHVGQVFATDRYLDAREWAPEAPMSLLVEPSAVAPYDFDATRLVVQHMDARHLLYPDDTFDGIFSSGSIEHVGELIDVANVAYEMGRVLKPGGVLSLSTELKLSGPPGGIGWPGQTLVLSPENLRRYVIEASGLEPVDELQITTSPATMATIQSLNGAIEDRRERIAKAAAGGDHDEFACWTFPHLVLEHGGYELTSVHLTLRKTDTYPAPDNEWAAPTAATLEAIRQHNLGLLSRDATPAAGAPAAPAEPRPRPKRRSFMRPRSAGDARSPADRYFARGEYIADIDEHLADLDRVVADVDRTLAAVGHQAAKVQAQLVRRVAEPPALDAPRLAQPALAQAASRTRWTTSAVSVGGLEFAVYDDPDGTGIASSGATGTSAETLVELMLELIQPGELVLDVGSGAGTFALAAAALGCRVLAVEPSAADAGRLRASAARNGFSEVRVVHAIAGDSVRPEGRVRDDATLAVVTDDLLAEFAWDPVALLRVGVGASTLAALRGMERLLGRDDAPPVLLEIDGRALAASATTSAEVLTELERHGYTNHLVEPERLITLGAGEPPPATVIDCLAWKRRPDRLGTRPVEPGLTLDDRVARLVADCRSSDETRRAHVAGLLSTADAAVLDHVEIGNALDRLGDDPSQAVLDAAAWWTSARRAAAGSVPAS